MRKTITISVSDEMYRLIHEGTRTHYCSTVSEYIRSLVRRDVRPETVIQEEPTYPTLRTANQWLEDAASEREADESLASQSL